VIDVHDRKIAVAAKNRVPRIATMKTWAPQETPTAREQKMKMMFRMEYQ
jgi:hypothetical protein